MSVNNELDRLLEKDLLEDVTEASPRVSYLVVFPKKSGDLGVCCNLREVPKVVDTLHAIHGSKCFAKIDAKSGFFQLTLAKESHLSGLSGLPLVSVMLRKLFKE